MRILLTNDDGILADGLWAMARELKDIAQLIVAAPDREQSAIGTAVTLRQVLRVRKMKPLLPDVETYAVEGTPSDSVILALGKLAKSQVDVIISGVNQGTNLGEDTHISGTVGAALQGYLRGFTSLAVSAPYGSEQHLATAARVAALLAQWICAGALPVKAFLNINVPDIPASQICGVKVTRLASESHINTVEEGDRGRQKYYWLVRQQAGGAADDRTDIWAEEHGYVSITPLFASRHDKPLLTALNALCPDIFRELMSAP
ncbi:MAG: 5'/3'-nucleotidase SurE [Chloroflexota bacterium]